MNGVASVSRGTNGAPRDDGGTSSRSSCATRTGSPDLAGGSVTALQASQIVDTAIARLSAPPPSAADSASGYAPAAQARRLSEEDLKKIVGMFGPGESALILMSPKPAISEIQRSLGVGAQSNAEIVALEVKQ